MNLTSNPTWNSFTSIITIIGIIAGIIFGIYSYAARTKASLYADVYPVPFDIPLKRFPSHSSSDILDFFENNEDKYKLIIQPNNSKPTLYLDLNDYLNSLYKNEKSIEEIILYTSGMVVMKITNEGTLPAKKVRVSIATAKLFAKKNESGLNIKWEIFAPDNEGFIIIPEIPQNTSISIFAWTGSDLSKSFQSYSDEGFRLSYSEGLGEVYIHRTVSSFFEFLDRYQFFILPLISWVLLTALLIFWQNIGNKSKESKNSVKTDND